MLITFPSCKGELGTIVQVNNGGENYSVKMDNWQAIHGGLVTVHIVNGLDCGVFHPKYLQLVQREGEMPVDRQYVMGMDTAYSQETIINPYGTSPTMRSMQQIADEYPMPKKPSPFDQGLQVFKEGIKCRE